ncbi:IPTL-CTERM sorting domain-containing protein [Brevundimonas sp.]|uniref:IPTL-CTERM sorting domain-containing protein n=1 Tax=Brevundimonas sp. TaxID=1871086 RepID=UPI003D0CC883
MQGVVDGRRNLIVGATIASGAWAFGSMATAASITVNTLNGTTANDGVCSLLEAAANANTDSQVWVDCAAGAGTDTIFLNGLSGTIVLSGQVALTTNAFIQGPGAAQLAISGNNASRVFYVHNAAVSISGVTITGGATGGAGGGGVFSNGGTLTISNSRITGNASGSARGGGIGANGGSVTITSSTISGNTGSRGGGVSLFNAAGSIDLTEISGNTASTRGGGVFLYNINSGTVSVTRSVVSGNTSNGRGGGLALYRVNVPTLIQDTTVSGNIANNRGGGLFLYKNAGAVTFDRVTVRGNEARTASGAGGGVYLYKTNSAVVFQNSTISGNSAATNGGGLAFRGPDTGNVTIGNTTIAGNTAGGAGGNINGGGSPLAVAVRNSIVADGTAGGVGPDISTGSLSLSVNYSLVENTSGATFTGANNLTGVDPQLGVFANNGGLTQTRMPSAAGPSVNAGDPAFAAPPSVDQTGNPRVANGRIDMGAVEIQAPLPVPTLGEWAMMMLTALLGLAGLSTLRRRAR